MTNPITDGIKAIRDGFVHSTNEEKLRMALTVTAVAVSAGLLVSVPLTVFVNPVVGIPVGVVAAVCLGAFVACMLAGVIGATKNNSFKSAAYAAVEGEWKHAGREAMRGVGLGSNKPGFFERLGMAVSDCVEGAKDCFREVKRDVAQQQREADRAERAARAEVLREKYKITG